MKYPREGQILLILDPSGSSIGWTIAYLKAGTFQITNSGALMASSSWDLGRRLNYMYKGVKHLVQTFKVNLIVSEEAIVAHGMAGAAVVPTIVNNLKMLTWDLQGGLELKTMHVDKWRKLLCISGVPAFDKKGKMITNKRGKQKKDFKVPTAQKVEEMLKFKLPAQILDNRSLKLKDLKNDVSDSLAIAIAYGMELGYPKIQADKDLFTKDETILAIKALFMMK